MSSSGAYRPRSTALAASSRTAASTDAKSGTASNACVGLRAPELLSGVGTLDADQPSLAVDVRPAERPKLAEAKAGAERDVEETDENRSGSCRSGSTRRQLDQRVTYRVGVRRAGSLAGEVLRRWEVSASGWVGHDHALSDRVREHLAKGRDDVADRSSALPSASSAAISAVDVLGSERRERPLAQARQDVLDEVRAGSSRMSTARAASGRHHDAGRVPAGEPALGVGCERFAAGLAPGSGVDLAFAGCEARSASRRLGPIVSHFCLPST